MKFARIDVDALTRAQHKFVPANFDGQSSLQYIEELICLAVVMSNLRSTRLHPFFDNAQCRGLD